MIILRAILVGVLLGLVGCGYESETKAEVVTLEVGDENCPLGGQRITAFLDRNHNGQWDDGEMRGEPKYICNEPPEPEEE